MPVNNGPNAIEHKNADCLCSRCKQLRKPDKIAVLPVRMFQQPVTSENKAISAVVPDNVIPISVAIKTAEKLRVAKARRASFNYPMLECS